MSRTDFSQVHHNILDDGTWGIMLGYEDPSGTIHKQVAYNNTITGTVSRAEISADNGIRRKYSSNFGQGSEPYPIYGWDYNNILDNCEANRDSDKSMSAGVQSGGAAMNLSNYYNANNYFYRPPESDIISLVHTTPISSDNSFTRSEFVSQTYTNSLRTVCWRNRVSLDKERLESSILLECFESGKAERILSLAPPFQNPPNILTGT